MVNIVISKYCQQQQSCSSGHSLGAAPGDPRSTWRGPPRAPPPRAAGEAEALFAPGQRFTIWADAVVDRTIRPEGLVGYGVIYGRKAPPLLGDDSDGIRRKAAGLARVHLLETGETVTGDRDQGLVVRKSRDATSPS